MNTPRNFFESIPASLPEELTEVLLESRSVRIERIVSQGHSSPEEFWYDQPEHEWVMVLQGEAKLRFADGQTIELEPGDTVLIEAHKRHRVEWTTPDQQTIWLAVFYSVDD